MPKEYVHVCSFEPYRLAYEALDSCPDLEDRAPEVYHGALFELATLAAEHYRRYADDYGNPGCTRHPDPERRAHFAAQDVWHARHADEYRRRASRHAGELGRLERARPAVAPDRCQELCMGALVLRCTRSAGHPGRHMYETKER